MTLKEVLWGSSDFEAEEQEPKLLQDVTGVPVADIQRWEQRNVLATKTCQDSVRKREVVAAAVSTFVLTLGPPAWSIAAPAMFSEATSFYVNDSYPCLDMDTVANYTRNDLFCEPWVYYTCFNDTGATCVQIRTFSHGFGDLFLFQTSSMVMLMISPILVGFVICLATAPLGTLRTRENDAIRSTAHSFSGLFLCRECCSSTYNRHYKRCHVAWVLIRVICPLISACLIAVIAASVQGPPCPVEFPMKNSVSLSRSFPWMYTVPIFWLVSWVYTTCIPAAVARRFTTEGLIRRLIRENRFEELEHCCQAHPIEAANSLNPKLAAVFDTLFWFPRELGLMPYWGCLISEAATPLHEACECLHSHAESIWNLLLDIAPKTAAKLDAYDALPVQVLCRRISGRMSYQYYLYPTNAPAWQPSRQDQISRRCFREAASRLIQTTARHADSSDWDAECVRILTRVCLNVLSDENYMPCNGLQAEMLRLLYLHNNDVIDDEKTMAVLFFTTGRPLGKPQAPFPFSHLSLSANQHHAAGGPESCSFCLSCAVRSFPKSAFLGLRYALKRLHGIFLDLDYDPLFELIYDAMTSAFRHEDMNRDELWTRLGWGAECVASWHLRCVVQQREKRRENILDVATLGSREIFVRFAAVVVDILPVYIRRFVRCLWEHVHGGIVWEDGVAVGRKLLWGDETPSLLIGNCNILNGTRTLTFAGDVRCTPANNAGIQHPTLRAAVVLRPGAPLLVNNFQKAIAMASNAIRYSSKKGHTTVTLDDAFYDPKHPRGARLSATARGLRGDFFLRQCQGNSAAKYRHVQDKLLQGNSDEWDTTLLTWLLLNSGHDGSSDAPVCRGLLGRIEAETRGLRGHFVGLRNLRNMISHASSWSMEVHEFIDNIGLAIQLLEGIDQCAVGLHWQKWTCTVDEFFRDLEQYQSGPHVFNESWQHELENGLRRKIARQSLLYSQQIDELKKQVSVFADIAETKHRLMGLDGFREFEVQVRLGRGATSTVLGCQCRGLPVAVKVLHLQGDRRTSVFNLNKSEFEIMTRLAHHENIAVLFAVIGSARLTPQFAAALPLGVREEHHLDTSPSSAFATGLVMPWYPMTLRFFLNSIAETVSSRSIASISTQILAGIDHLFNNGVVHFDLNLDNILAGTTTENTDGCKIVIADFGCAKMVGLTPGFSGDMHLTVNNGSSLRGNLCHRCPEAFVVEQSEGDCTLNLVKQPSFAAGVLLTEVSTGQLPVPDYVESAHAGRSREALQRLDISQLRDDVSPRFEELVIGLLMHDPDDRLSVADAYKAISSKDFFS